MTPYFHLLIAHSPLSLSLSKPYPWSSFPPHSPFLFLSHSLSLSPHELILIVFLSIPHHLFPSLRGNPYASSTSPPYSTSYSHPFLSLQKQKKNLTSPLLSLSLYICKSYNFPGLIYNFSMIEHHCLQLPHYPHRLPCYPCSSHQGSCSAPAILRSRLQLWVWYLGLWSFVFKFVDLILWGFGIGDACIDGIGVQFMDCFGFYVLCYIWSRRKCQEQEEIGVLNLIMIFRCLRILLFFFQVFGFDI